MLLAAFPDLKEAVEIRDDYFFLETRVPAGWSLWISSDCEELTIGFAEHHCHFGSIVDQDAPDYAQLYVAEALTYLQDLREGQMGVAVWLKDGQLSLSYSFCLTDGPIPEKPNFFRHWWMKRRQLVVRKWAKT